ncbi:MAG: YHS domain-containing protein [Dehalococcoidia bacterium]|nr:YHS domain-containing protein [Dehalococcoidia bacterium]
MAELVKDVVCGMDIDPATAAATSEYRGETYYFCAAGCKQDFDAAPEKHLGGASTAAESDKRWWEFWKA